MPLKKKANQKTKKRNKLFNSATAKVFEPTNCQRRKNRKIPML